MFFALCQGLGFGLSFWCVIIPVFWLFSPRQTDAERLKEHQEFNKKLLEYWESSITTHDEIRIHLSTIAAKLNDYETK